VSLKASVQPLVILGAGPTGLGAAWRLTELGGDFDLYEATADVGGLARSILDERGYTWDLGAHLQFSHYDYFDRLSDELMQGECTSYERSTWVWLSDRFVPYPLQLHLERLPEDLRRRCREGLEQARAGARSRKNFHEWIVSEFGRPLAECFMFPQNTKSWAHPLSEMSCGWIGERVARPDAAKRAAWGPNRTFRYPNTGGSGEMWSRLARRLPSGRLHLQSEVVSIDTRRKRVQFAGGEERDYGALISTIPLDVLVARSDRRDLDQAAQGLVHSAVHVVGLGLRGQPPKHLEDKHWMYFPEDNCLFHRATVLSNYAPHSVPKPGAQWAIMFEISESEHRPIDSSSVLEDAVAGAVATGLVEREDIEHQWVRRAEHGYPTPTLSRDPALDVLLPALEEVGIYSRGRFGAWKYEVSNQDHSLMQGVELVDRLFDSGSEPTLGTPDVVNSKRVG